MVKTFAPHTKVRMFGRKNRPSRESQCPITGWFAQATDWSCYATCFKTFPNRAFGRAHEYRSQNHCKCRFTPRWHQSSFCRRRKWKPRTWRQPQYECEKPSNRKKQRPNSYPLIGVIGVPCKASSNGLNKLRQIDCDAHSRFFRTKPTANVCLSSLKAVLKTAKIRNYFSSFLSFIHLIRSDQVTTISFHILL